MATTRRLLPGIGEPLAIDGQDRGGMGLAGGNPIKRRPLGPPNQQPAGAQPDLPPRYALPPLTDAGGPPDEGGVPPSPQMDTEAPNGSLLMEMLKRLGVRQ